MDESETGGQSLIELESGSGDRVVKLSSVGREVGDDVSGDDGQRRGHVAVRCASA